LGAITSDASVRPAATTPTRWQRRCSCRVAIASIIIGLPGCGGVAGRARGATRSPHDVSGRRTCASAALAYGSRSVAGAGVHLGPDSIDAQPPSRCSVHRSSRSSARCAERASRSPGNFRTPGPLGAPPRFASTRRRWARGSPRRARRRRPPPRSSSQAAELERLVALLDRGRSPLRSMRRPSASFWAPRKGRESPLAGRAARSRTRPVRHSARPTDYSARSAVAWRARMRLAVARRREGYHVIPTQQASGRC